MDSTVDSLVEASPVINEANSFTLSYTTLAILISSIILYIVYYSKYREAEFLIKPRYDQKKKKIGKPLPPYPNGWYVAVHSRDLKVGESKAVDIAGENIAVFRAKDGKAHALHAYCAHMGVHLGVGGKVVNNQCIQCPFHGWVYDG